MFLMRFDLRAPASGAPPRELYGAALDMAAWAESRGCAIAALSEHHGTDDGYLPSPLVMAAAMAARTSTLPIMIAAALLPFYDPVRLAEDIAVLDHVSGGRVSYVLGLGYRPEEYAMYGVDFERRGRVADAKLEALLRALDAEVTPRPDLRPQIAWGGESPAAARRAARFGLNFFAQTDGPELERAYLDECARVGRQPGVCSLPNPDDPMTVFVADDVERAWAELGSYLLHDAVTYAGWNEGKRTASLSRGRTVDELRAERGAHRIFSTNEAAEHLRTHRILPLHPLCGGLPPAIAWSYLERAAEVTAR